jgi:hypothetical protein
MNGRPCPEQQTLLVISTRTIRQAEKRIYSCEHCCPLDAEIPFDWILDEVTGSDSTVTNYVMENAAICPCLLPRHIRENFG